MKPIQYHKLILKKVSFHPYLFKKEYRKALKALTIEDAHTLRHWCRYEMR